MISFTCKSFSCTLIQNINWYNLTRIVSGIYTETELHSNLTSTASTIKSAICPAPDALTATDIMANTANLGWTENGTAIARKYFRYVWFRNRNLFYESNNSK
jgi:hypothetical protein